MRFVIESRLSECCAASDARAPAALKDDFSVEAYMSIDTSGSMPPSFAMVALLGACSCARDQSADAACSLVSGLPSRTRVHRGTMPPARAMAAWLSALERAKLEMAPDALDCISGSGLPKTDTRGVMTPACVAAL